MSRQEATSLTIAGGSLAAASDFASGSSTIIGKVECDPVNCFFVYTVNDDCFARVSSEQAKKRNQYSPTQ